MVESGKRGWRASVDGLLLELHTLTQAASSHALLPEGYYLASVCSTYGSLCVHIESGINTI